MLDVSGSLVLLADPLPLDEEQGSVDPSLLALLDPPLLSWLDEPPEILLSAATELSTPLLDDDPLLPPASVSTVVLKVELRMKHA